MERSWEREKSRYSSLKPQLSGHISVEMTLPRGGRRRLHLAPFFFLVVIIGAILGCVLCGVALGQSSDNPLDLRKGFYEPSHILSQLPDALPSYIAGACAFLLLGKYLGFYEMAGLTQTILLAIIGGIIYRYYLPPR
jgi:hypothetical protein